uniref:Uncharacterized protein n=1 Tax=Oryza rufipogon TaxID=4529 RepID=A0A0E0NW14_ORYRU
MGPTPIANHHTEERWVAMLGTHLRRQASTWLHVPIPTQLRYVLLLRVWLWCNDKGHDAPMGSVCT